MNTTMTALRLSYVRAVDATLTASPRRLSDRTSWADMDWGGCGQGGRGRQKAVFSSFHAKLRPLRGHPCTTYHLNPRQTLQHQPDCAPHATWRVPHGGGQGGVRSVASTVSTGTTRRTVRAPRIADFAAH